jgi:predicted transglutaminase-like cysteine proteinase
MDASGIGFVGAGKAKPAVDSAPDFNRGMARVKQLLEHNSMAALPLAAPVAATATVMMVGVAVVGGLGIGWNSLSSHEQRIVRETVSTELSDLARRGALGLRDIGENARNIGEMPRQATDTIRRAVMEALAASASAPTLDRVIEAVKDLPVVNQCQPRRPEDLIGLCGECTADAYGQLRQMGIRRITQEPVANGAHYVLKIMTDQGNYILDCTLGQFGGVNGPDSPWSKANLLQGNGNNVVLVKEEVYRRLLEQLPSRVYL